MVNDVAKSVPNIYAIVENQQTNHPDFVVDMEGIITKQPISIIIDPGFNISYISPQIVKESL